MTATKTPRATRAKTASTPLSTESAMPVNAEPTTEMTLTHASEVTTTEVATPAVTEMTDDELAFGGLTLSFESVVVTAPKARVSKPSAVIWHLSPTPSADTKPDIHAKLGIKEVPFTKEGFPNDYDESKPRRDTKNNATVRYVKHANKSTTFYVDFDGEPIDGSNPTSGYKHTEYEPTRETRGVAYTITVHFVTALLAMRRKMNPDLPTRYAVAITHTAATTENPHTQRTDAKYTPIVVPYISRIADVCAIVSLATTEGDPTDTYKVLLRLCGLKDAPALTIKTNTETPAPEADII